MNTIKPTTGLATIVTLLAIIVIMAAALYAEHNRNGGIEPFGPEYGIEAIELQTTPVEYSWLSILDWLEENAIEIVDQDQFYRGLAIYTRCYFRTLDEATGESTSLCAVGIEQE